MTISTSTRTAGPFVGTGSLVGYPFAFKVFTTADLLIQQTDTGGVVTTWALGANYTVVLNADQSVSPGGVITPLAALPAGFVLNVTSAITLTQSASLTNAGGFFPKVIEDALDRLTILIQQALGSITGALRVPEITGTAVLPAAASRANQLLSFDSVGNPIAVAPAAGTATALAVALAASTGPTGVGTAFGTTLAVDLASARPVARGGTGATTAGGALQNLGLIDLNSSVNLTGTTALTLASLGKCIVLGDSGSPANYVVTLPASAPVGSIIMVRVVSTATKLYGINGNDVAIDSIQQRILWAGESALLLREAANWTKIGGKARPFVGGIQRLTNQTGIVANTNTQVSFTSAFGDPSGLNLAYNSGTGNISIPRAGNYNVEGNLSIAGTSLGGNGAQIALIQNAGTPAISPNATINAIVGAGASRFMAGVSGLFSCAGGDGIGMIGNIGGGTALIFEFVSNSIAPTLTYQEVPTW